MEVRGMEQIPETVKHEHIFMQARVQLGMLRRMGHGVDGRAATSTRLDLASAKAIASTLQALATPSRLLILGRLREGPATVGELTQSVQMEQSAVSQQLRLLRNLGL